MYSLLGVANEEVTFIYLTAIYRHSIPHHESQWHVTICNFLSNHLPYLMSFEFFFLFCNIEIFFYKKITTQRKKINFLLISEKKERKGPDAIFCGRVISCLHELVPLECIAKCGSFPQFPFPQNARRSSLSICQRRVALSVLVNQSHPFIIQCHFFSIPKYTHFISLCQMHAWEEIIFQNTKAILLLFFSFCKQFKKSSLKFIKKKNVDSELVWQVVPIALFIMHDSVCVCVLRHTQYTGGGESTGERGRAVTLS